MNALIDLEKCREYLTITIDNQTNKIGLNGTIDIPYFCYKDISDILGYKNPKDALYRHVDSDDKISLQELMNENKKLVRVKQTNFLGITNHNLSYHAGKAMYINESGLYSLINGSDLLKNKKELLHQLDKWFYDLRYGANTGLMDIFTFVKGFGVTFDVNSDWFQDLWYPLSKNQGAPRGALEKIGGRPIILTQNLLEWMGYKGRKEADKQGKFCKLLRSLEIEYEEIGFEHPLAIEYPCVQKEVKTIGVNNLEKKKWISMDVRAFKKAVLRLNTENAEVVRDYYLNLEEAMFAYGDYTMNFLIQKAEKERKIKINELSIAKQQLAIKDKSHENQLSQMVEQLAIKDKEVEQEKEARVKAERKAIRVNKFMKRITIKEKKIEWIYIATTRYYSGERLFKVGSTTRLSSRISGYNTGRPKEDSYYYCWVKKCYNSKDLDYHIQKLLFDFKHRENAELYCGIKFSDLQAIVNFIVDNYDESIDYINKFIKTRLNDSLEEEDEEPPRLDYKKISYQIGDHVETIDLEEEDSSVIRDELENILTSIKEQHEDEQVDILIIDRKELIDRLVKVTNTTKKELWGHIKDYTGWTNSKTEIEDGRFKYKITY
ncbi:hypothetical protein WIV_gp088 [Wiseana iridescent virus]|uniref:Bro-N domain-containing protein n=1 Tax=Wiseana iridescent virus TaxID=68347 RepID=G0T5B4_IRV9|nr:hypothetical protein WIV_gp088 [Wiseana iridescent virus]ADO00431.1 hypothetical protein [Wiseana iridescent virus]